MRPAEGGMRGEPSVLAVDDNARGRMAIESVLRGEGYRVRTAEDGPSALEAAREEPPDVVLLDVMMPGMDGFEVCRRMRRDPELSQVPVVMVTALDDRASRLEGIEAGADDFLTKPLDRQELRARVRTITDLNRYRQLNAERAKLERLIALSPDGIVVLDTVGRILHANPAFGGLTDRPIDEMEGRLIWGFIAEASRSDGQAFHARVLNGGAEHHQVELRMANEDRDTRHVEISAGTSPWNGGRAVQWVVRDVSGRKRMEEQLRRVQRFEDIARLTSSIAHDFRNYLTAILSSSDLLLLDADLEGEAREDLETIRRAATKASSVCQQLLAFSGQRKGDPQVVDLRQIVRGIESILPHLTTKSVEIVLELGSEPLPVRVDPGLMEQVVVNLVVNARDAMDGKSGRIRVRTEPEAVSGGREADVDDSEGRVLLAVQDEGVGMDEDTIARIFDPYFTTKDTGTGLGLSTVHGIVKKAGGDVQVLSRPGEGTDFRILLPRVPAAVPDGAREA